MTPWRTPDVQVPQANYSQLNYLDQVELSVLTNDNKNRHQEFLLAKSISPENLVNLHGNFIMKERLMKLRPHILPTTYKFPLFKEV